MTETNEFRRQWSAPGDCMAFTVWQVAALGVCANLTPAQRRPYHAAVSIEVKLSQHPLSRAARNANLSHANA